MGGVAKKVANGFDKFVHSDAGWVLPMVKGPAMAVEALTKMRPSQQYTLGATVGTAGAAGAAFAPGAMASINGMLPGAGAAGGLTPMTAGVNGATSAAGGLGSVAGAGGLPLVTKVLLGASVASTMASFFGFNNQNDYQKALDQMSDADRAQIKMLEDNLTQIQSNLSARQQAVSQIVNNYPNVVNDALKEISSGPLGQTLDANSRIALDQASNQLAGKYAAQGGFSSGAFSEGLSRTAANLTMDTNAAKIDMAREMAKTKLLDAQSQLAFQQKMLGLGTDQIFTANQNALDRLQRGELAISDADAADRASRRDSLAKLGGNLAKTGIDIWGYRTLSNAMNVNRMASPGGGTAQLPGGGTPLPQMTDASAGWSA